MYFNEEVCVAPLRSESIVRFWRVACPPPSMSVHKRVSCDTCAMWQGQGRVKSGMWHEMSSRERGAVAEELLGQLQLSHDTSATEAKALDGKEGKQLASCAKELSWIWVWIPSTNRSIPVQPTLAVVWPRLSPSLQRTIITLNPIFPLVYRKYYVWLQRWWLNW